MTAQPDLQLFHSRGACSAVVLRALKHAGLQATVTTVDVAGGEQTTAAYRAVNPHAKVPALLVDGRLLVEVVAILLYIDDLRPDAGLLPPGQGFQRASVLSDLVWCAATLHPIVRIIRAPSRVTIGEEAGVRAKGLQLLEPVAVRAEQRFASQRFWFGDAWSIVDAYVAWAMLLAEVGGFELERFPALRAHAAAEAVHLDVVFPRPGTGASR